MLYGGLSQGLGRLPAATLQQRSKSRSRRLSHTAFYVRAIAEPFPKLEEETELKPAYNKYRTPGEIARANVREFRELSADGYDIPPPTVASVLAYPFQFVKYKLAPEILRYAWYCVWVKLCEASYPFHKKLVLQGAKVDAYLRRKANPGHSMKIDRQQALRHFHGNVSLKENVLTRFLLIRAAFWPMLSSWKQRNIRQAEEANLAAPKII